MTGVVIEGTIHFWLPKSVYYFFLAIGQLKSVYKILIRLVELKLELDYILLDTEVFLAPNAQIKYISCQGLIQTN